MDKEDEERKDHYNDDRSKINKKRVTQIIKKKKERKK
jgi:hypothetical protein